MKHTILLVFVLQKVLLLLPHVSLCCVYTSDMSHARFFFFLSPIGQVCIVTYPFFHFLFSPSLLFCPPPYPLACPSLTHTYITDDTPLQWPQPLGLVGDGTPLRRPLSPGDGTPTRPPPPPGLDHVVPLREMVVVRCCQTLSWQDTNIYRTYMHTYTCIHTCIHTYIIQ